MKKPAPTLADEVLRHSFALRHSATWAIKADVVQKLLPMARKFVLDDKMSAFLGHLGLACLAAARTEKKALVILDSMRKLARLPHRLMWVEYNNTERIKMIRDTYDISTIMDMGEFAPDEQSPRCGWLLEQHDKIETAFRATLYSSEVTTSSDSFDYPHPSVYSALWCSEDHPLPWPDIIDMPRASMLLTGIYTYHSPYVGVGIAPTATRKGFELFNQFVESKEKEKGFDSSKGHDIGKLSTIIGELRYIWALLSTINTLPIKTSFTTAAKGFVAKGRYRRFVDHTTVTLNIPETRYRRIAAHAIASARRRAHEVRGHWRDNWRLPKGNKSIWVPEHQSGDASLGFVTHDYEVKHDEETRPHSLPPTLGGGAGVPPHPGAPRQPSPPKSPGR
jgi:hypothetical protein